LAAAEWAVESVLKKYSAFVGFPVTLNGKRTNSIDALWTKRASEVSDEDATAFYRFVGRRHRHPRVQASLLRGCPADDPIATFRPDG
jgi:HSP90 family molecular chaperone